MTRKRATQLSSLGALALIAIITTALLLRDPTDVASSIDAGARTLDRGLIGEPESLRHHYFSSDQAAEVLRDTGEGLITVGPDGALLPGVAASWTLSDDGLVYQFRIRDDAVWSDGSKISTQDFVETYRALADPSRGAVNANALKPVQNAAEIISGEAPLESLGVVDVSPDVLEIRLQSPTSYFLQLLTHPSLYPVHSQARTRQGTSMSDEVSNGAFQIVDWVKGSEISLRKNPKYWNSESVYFDEVTYHIVDEGSEFGRFRAGELDITGTVASGIFPIALRDFPDELKIAPRLGVYYYGFNLDNPIFSNNPGLRRALSLSIDRNLLVEKITSRGEESAFGWVPPGTHNYDSQTISELRLDKDQRERKAKQLYESAGYGTAKVLQFELRYNKSDVQERIALAISSMWRDVLGVEVKLVGEEFQVLLENIRARDITDVFRLSWTGNYNDAQTFLELFESDHPQNLTGYHNSEYDELMRAGRREIDPKARKEILEAAERVALSDHPVIPIYFYVSKHLVNSRIEGWSPNVLDIHLSQHLRAAE